MNECCCKYCKGLRSVAFVVDVAKCVEEGERVETGECDHLSSSLEDVGHGHVHCEHMIHRQDADSDLPGVPGAGEQESHVWTLDLTHVADHVLVGELDSLGWTCSP